MQNKNFITRLVILIHACIFGLSVATAVIFHSAGFTSAQQSENNTFNRKAYDHFRNGLLLNIKGDTEEAIKELIRAVQIDSGNAVILKTLGDFYFKAHNYTMGTAVYEKYLAKKPFHDRIIDIVLREYLRSRPIRLGRIENVLSMVTGKGNDQPRYYVMLTDILLKQNKIERARNMSIRYIKRTGESQDACEEVAEMFKNNSMVVEGIEFFSKYLEDNPGSVNIGIVVGRLYEAREEPQSAETAYLAVLKKNEIAYRARLHLAEMYIKADKIDDALHLYEGISFDDPMEVQVKLAISERFLRKTPDVPYAKMEKILKTVTGKAGSDSEVFYYLGRAQAGQERYGESVESYNQSLRHDPVNVVVLFYLAQAELERENLDGAMSAISKAVHLNPEEKAFYIFQGLVYDRMGDFENAVSTYEAGIAVQPSDNSAQATLLNNYSYLLSEHEKDLEKALDMAKDAVQSDPENSSFLDTIGWVYFKLGNLEEAFENIKKAVDKDPQNAEILDHFGDVYHKMGEINMAKEFWRKALGYDKDNKEIKEKLRMYNE